VLHGLSPIPLSFCAWKKRRPSKPSLTWACALSFLPSLLSHSC
jgi:hypothetical protein